MGLEEEEEEEENGGMCSPMGFGSCGQGGGDKAGARLRAKLSLPQPFLSSPCLGPPSPAGKERPPCSTSLAFAPHPPSSHLSDASKAAMP